MQRRMTKERHSMYKGTGNSFRVGRDQLLVVNLDINNDECTTKGKSWWN